MKKKKPTTKSSYLDAIRRARQRLLRMTKGPMREDPQDERSERSDIEERIQFIVARIRWHTFLELLKLVDLPPRSPVISGIQRVIKMPERLLLRAVVFVLFLFLAYSAFFQAPSISDVVSTQVTPSSADTPKVSTTGHRLPVGSTPDGSAPSDRASAQRFVLSDANLPEVDWQAGHRGVDLAAVPGQQIYASKAGIVHFAGTVGGTPVVSISHDERADRPTVRSTYEPIIAHVKKGERVRRGQVIGILADAQRLPDTARRSPGLSWGIRIDEQAQLQLEGRPRGTVYLDPLDALGSGRVRLLP